MTAPAWPAPSRVSARCSGSASTPIGLLISGSVLAANLPGLLAILADALTGATYPERRGRDRAQPAGRAADDRPLARRRRRR